MEAEIQSFSLKGYGTADGVEIAHTVPGDRILFEMTRKKRLPKKGRLLEVLTPSTKRVQPRCIHAHLCGGCCWQQMDYLEQLKEKEARVRKAFQRECCPILPCEQPFGYRNKMEFTFSENRAGQKYLGLMIAQAEPYVFNLTECHLTSPWFSEVVCSVRSWWEDSRLNAYYPPKDEGALRYLTLREAVRTNQKMAILNVSSNPEFALKNEEIKGFVEAVLKVTPDASVFLRIHQTKKGTPTEFQEVHLAGQDHIMEELHIFSSKLQFKISPSSFFQPNTLGAEKLYQTALSFLDPFEEVFDLYCGTGTLGMVASQKAKKVTGVELNANAVQDARENMKRNGIENMQVIEGDVGKVVEALLGEPGRSRPDTIIVDPPRAGLDERALRVIKSLTPQNILYISCNPITQAANVEELKKAGYVIQTLQPIDQFPHTYHIENIALLKYS